MSNDGIGDDDALRSSVAATGRGAVITRTTHDPEQRAYLRRRRLVDLVVVPVFRGGVIVGTLAAHNRLGDVSSFDQEDVKVFATLAHHRGHRDRERPVDRAAPHRGVAEGVPVPPRHAHRPRQPRPLRRAHERRAPRESRRRLERRRDADGPQPLQGRERHARPPPRRPPAPGGRAADRDRAARARPDRAARRRRVRGAAPPAPHRRPGRGDRVAHPGRVAAADGRGPGAARGERGDRHLDRARARHRGRHPAPARRHRDVQREGEGRRRHRDLRRRPQPAQHAPPRARGRVAERRSPTACSRSSTSRRPTS